jgi:hypothetical protein
VLLLLESSPSASSLPRWGSGSVGSGAASRKLPSLEAVPLGSEFSLAASPRRH